MRLRDVAFLPVFALVSTNATAQTSPNIASTSLCGDSYLLAVAPGHISALSWQSRDRLSRAPEAYRALPQIWDDPETITASNTELILFGAGEGQITIGILEQQGRRAIALEWGEDFASVFANLDLIDQALDGASQARPKSADIKQRLEALEMRARQRQSAPKVLYLSRAGGSAGPGTFVDAAIAAAGGQNVLSTPGWVTLDIEALINLKPDLIVTSFFESGYESVNASGLRHGAVKNFLARHERLDIPGQLWPCAGPDLIEVAELIAAKLEGLP